MIAPGSVPISLWGGLRRAASAVDVARRPPRPHDASRWPAMRVLFATAELAPVASGRRARRGRRPGCGAELRRHGVDVDVVAARLRAGGATPLGRRGRAGASTCPAGRRRRSVRIGEHAVAGRVHLVSVPGIARSHPYLRPDGAGWPDNAGPLPRLQPRRRGARPARPARRAAPQRLAHRRRARRAAGAAADACCRCTTSPTRASTDGSVAARGSARAAGTTSGGAAPTRCRAAIALADAVVAVSPHHAREILTPAGGFGLDGPLRHRGDAVIGHPQRHRHRARGTRRPTATSLATLLGRRSGRRAGRQGGATGAAVLERCRLARRRHARSP